MPHLRRREFLFVRQIETQRCDGHKTLLDSPAVSSLFGSFNRNDGEPKVLTTHGIFAWHDLTVVVPDRLARPAQALRPIVGKIDVDERQLRVLEQYVQHSLNRGL